MKNLNKVFALLVVFTMVLSTVVFASPFDDVSDDANYAEAVITLSTLGLFKGDDKGNFNPDKTITRAEFATVVVRTMGMGDPGPTATVFTDVPATHWASGYVQAATNMGILAGYGDGTFGPDDPVTYEQAIKMIVAALGYTPEAENRGGYPTGYMMIAAREGITEGANGKVGEQAPRATVAQLLYNALDVPLMVQTGFGSQVTYEVMDGRNDRDFQTILSSKLGITKVEGVITNNYLTEDIGARNKKVKIEITRVNDMRITDYQDKIDDVDDKPNILVGNTNAKDYLGYTVVGYVKDFDTTDATFLSVTPKTGKNQVITVTDMANIDGNNLLTPVTSGYRFEYWRDRDTDKRAEQVDVSANYKYYRDGLEEGDDPTKPTSGKVVLLDNDDDDIYDYIFVTEYRYVVVDEVFDGDVQSLTSYGVFFDDDDDDLEYVIYLDGKEIGWEDLEKWDVISLVVTEGNNGKTRYTAYVTRDSVQGIVNEDLSDDYGTKYGIDGKEYVFVDDVEGASVRLGNEYTFFLNVDGNVVYVEKGTTVGGRKTPFNYAILYEAAIESTLSDTLQVELFTSEGKWVVYETSDRVYINGDRFDVKNLFNAISNGDSRLEGLFTVSDGSIKVATKPTLIAYKLDSSGYLRDLDFARDDINKDDYISLDEASDSALYRASTKRLGKGYITDYTVIFAIKGEGTRKEDYSIVTASAFTDGEPYKADLYDIEEGNEVSAIVAFDVTGTVGEEAGFFVVKSVSESRDEDDDTIYIFRGLQDGKETTITVSDDVYVTRLVPRDGNPEDKVYIDKTMFAAETAPSSFIKNMKEYVIQYSVNARDEVDSIRIIYDPNDEDFYADAFSADIGKENSDLVISYGKVTDKRSGRLSISTMDGTSEEEVTSVNVSGAKFTQINYDYAPSSRVRTASINDVKVDSSIVIVREYDGAVKDIVIINGK